MTKKRPLESDKENENVQPMTKKQKVIGDTIATILKAPPTKKKPTIADRKFQPKNQCRKFKRVLSLFLDAYIYYYSRGPH